MRLSPSDASPRVYRVRLTVAALECRDVPSVAAAPLASLDVQATVLAGRTAGQAADAPSDRIDPNSTSSPFAGVGSLLITSRQVSYIGTATAIDRWHVLTAAHVVDLNDDGRFDRRDKTTGVFFNLNFGDDVTHRIAIAKFHLSPNFSGFNRPAINDDFAILTLAEELPEGVPTYGLSSQDLSEGTTITMVGYGRSGSGATGYTTQGSLSIKRVGENVIDGFYGQDDSGHSPANEVFRFDFDGPSGNGPLGGPSLGNDRETQLGSGDSGGPAFVLAEGAYRLVGVNSYVQGTNAPRFGSLGGGTNLYPHLDLIGRMLAADAAGKDYKAEDHSTLPDKDGGGESGSGGQTASPAEPGIGVGAKPIRGTLPRNFAAPPPNFSSSTPMPTPIRYWWIPPVPVEEERPLLEILPPIVDALVAEEIVKSLVLVSSELPLV